MKSTGHLLCSSVNFADRLLVTRDSLGQLSFIRARKVKHLFSVLQEDESRHRTDVIFFCYLTQFVDVHLDETNLQYGSRYSNFGCGKLTIKHNLHRVALQPSSQPSVQSSCMVRTYRNHQTSNLRASGSCKIGTHQVAKKSTTTSLFWLFFRSSSNSSDFVG